MAYTLAPTITFEGLITYVSSAAAALRVTPNLGASADAFDAQKVSLRAARDARDDARDALAAASRVVKVRDAEWDKAVLDLSGRAFLAAGEDASKAPYAPLFGSITARVATGLGPAKASDFGERLVRIGAELAHPELTDSLARVTAANTALRDAGATRTAAQREAQAHDIKRLVAKDAVELLAANTEVAILTAHVGRSDLVRAALAPERAPRPSTDQEPDEAVTPEPEPEPLG